jgi:tripartite-type tricarboxylate transporter receptor subunit TctC
MPRITWAQAYPMRPVHIIVGFAGGGGVDITARLIGQWLSERLGQNFVIEDRPGRILIRIQKQAVRAP